MEWGIGIIVVFLLLTAYVIIQETRAQLHWRGLVAGGDVDAVRSLVEDEIETWHTARVPRGTPALLWHGVQTVEMLDVTARAAHVSCTADGEYALVGGRRIETSSPLAEGMKITIKLAEMMLFDIPNVKLDRVQIDVYTAFRDLSGHAETQCILSTLVEREDVEHIDWEQTPPTEFIALTEGRFATEASDTIGAIEPLDWEEAVTREEEHVGRSEAS